MSLQASTAEKEPEHIRAWTHRALDPEVAARLGARFAARKYQFEFRSAEGEKLFTKFQNTRGEYWIDPAGSSLVFWNLAGVPLLPERPKEPLIITEGEKDLIAVIQSCGGYVLSVPNGTAGKRSQGDIVVAEDTRFSYLWEDEKIIPQVDQFDKIILCVDGDLPGNILRDELALRLGDSRCWYVEYPKGCKDANDVLLKHGEEGVRALVSGAKPMRPGFLVKPSQIPPGDDVQGITSGYSFFDKYFRISRPEFIVVTGEPNHGKGLFIRCLALKLAETHGWKTSMITPEDPVKRVRGYLRRYALRKHAKVACGEVYSTATEEDREAADKWIDNHFRLQVPPDDHPLTLDLVKAEMRSAALHHDSDVFVLDPWNEVMHDFGRLTETQYTERAIVDLKALNRHLGMCMIVAVHPHKLEPGRIADLYAINGSANWRNKCEHGVIVHYDEETGESSWIVGKAKDWETMGRPGQVRVKFNENRYEFMEVK